MANDSLTFLSEVAQGAPQVQQQYVQDVRSQDAFNRKKELRRREDDAYNQLLKEAKTNKNFISQLYHEISNDPTYGQADNIIQFQKPEVYKDPMRYAEHVTQVKGGIDKADRKRQVYSKVQQTLTGAKAPRYRGELARTVAKDVGPAAFEEPGVKSLIQAQPRRPAPRAPRAPRQPKDPYSWLEARKSSRQDDYLAMLKKDPFKAAEILAEQKAFQEASANPNLTTIPEANKEYNRILKKKGKELRKEAEADAITDEFQTIQEESVDLEIQEKKLQKLIDKSKTINSIPEYFEAVNKDDPFANLEAPPEAKSKWQRYWEFSTGRGTPAAPVTSKVPIPKKKVKIRRIQ